MPAHDEEAGIAATVQSLLALDHPRELFRVRVVADNCTDATAARAAAAGAEVLVRQDPGRRGKGFALAYAFERLLEEGAADAVVLVEADSSASGNLLAAFEARLTSGAQAVQADYGVRNPGDSWRTRLLAIALGAFHVLRSTARERLGVSCGLRGNGMCFTTAVLREVPHRAFSLVEDLEYGVLLGEAGHRVHYAGEAHVYGHMVSGERSARSQRQRWEGGRSRFARERGPSLVRQALVRRSGLLLDLAMDVFVPPLSSPATIAGLGLLVSLAAGARGATLLSGFSLCALAAYVLRGWTLSRTGAPGLRDLLLAPFYVLWKLSLRLRAGASGAWVRTEREGQPPRE